MYFPYLRGRQNELLCLRELLDEGKLKDKVLPIIEPVRCNSTFFSTLKRFVEEERDIIIIRNPKVGTFKSDYEKLKKKIESEKSTEKKNNLEQKLLEYRTLVDNPHVIKAYLFDEKKKSKYMSDDLQNVVLINTSNATFDNYVDCGKELIAKYTLIPKDEEFKDEVFGDVVALEDGFVKAKRNIDYLGSDDENFSRNHIVFGKRGYVGFSDYSIVGDVYEESGFAPLAVAIHILYFGKREELRVHHFVSDSNENIADPARKFEEAMRKLINWENFNNIYKTYGLNKLIDYYNSGKFPGLGVIKKYSIMHHLELMGDYLEK